MSARKSVLKVFIIIILAVFLLSTGLISVLYLGGSSNSNGTGDVLSGDVVESGISDALPLDSGVTELPQITKEEAAQKMQALLSGVSISGSSQ